MPDILWRNGSTGDNYVWYMDGVAVLAGGNLPTVADQNWSVVGIGDFNNDDNPDVLWRNVSTGENYVWYLDGVTVLGGGNLPTIADQNWKVVGVGDFNKDDQAGRSVAVCIHRRKLCLVPGWSDGCRRRFCAGSVGPELARRRSRRTSTITISPTSCGAIYPRGKTMSGTWMEWRLPEAAHCR